MPLHERYLEMAAIQDAVTQLPTPMQAPLLNALILQIDWLDPTVRARAMHGHLAGAITATLAAQSQPELQAGQPLPLAELIERLPVLSPHAQRGLLRDAHRLMQPLSDAQQASVLPLLLRPDLLTEHRISFFAEGMDWVQSLPGALRGNPLSALAFSIGSLPPEERPSARDQFLRQLADLPAEQRQHPLGTMANDLAVLPQPEREGVAQLLMVVTAAQPLAYQPLPLANLVANLPRLNLDAAAELSRQLAAAVALQPPSIAAPLLGQLIRNVRPAQGGDPDDLRFAALYQAIAPLAAPQRAVALNVLAREITDPDEGWEVQGQAARFRAILAALPGLPPRAHADVLERLIGDLAGMDPDDEQLASVAIEQSIGTLGPEYRMPLQQLLDAHRAGASDDEDGWH
ncbi:MAG TPA: hypothetical protein VFR90_06530 [Methylibium sp.]|uniref:hypothetical protein n=1 Tax=Methylibium sp. TaxID=2067992 RepID=UPI002DC009A0|nr:hypothetical protein [Methylibium sp.]HEU4458761.1 hypothetical protein [Methylibium sp.]